MSKTASNYWAMGLLNTIKAKENHLLSSDLAVVIADKYPKARYHYLVIPFENISTIFDLKTGHLNLLRDLHALAIKIIDQHELDNFKIGFHAEPSMQNVHLHVISKDFVSESLKTKKHWNSFNTRFFRPYQDVYDELVKNGSVKRWDKTEIKDLLASNLKCNQCDFIAKNMPTLKNHLLKHFNDGMNEIKN